jgi:choline dehydrogenase-like flavoprotein
MKVMTAVANDLHFDFVIVGAGSAGCVLANRLSADPQVRVCLIEAGPADTHPLIKIPPAIAFTLRNPKLGWGLKSAPQRHAGDRELPIPRGRVLGGSSSVNGMVYFRGHPGDFDDWAQTAGPGWSYREVLPYFLRSERNEAFPDSPYHGTRGPMNVISIARPNVLVTDFVAAAQSCGFPRCEDFNGADPEGFGPRQATILRGRRVSMASAFLKPVRSRPNLLVMTDTLVTRVLMEGRSAIGVEYERSGSQGRILAGRETLLCAGSYLSPALLNRSGVGDGKVLQQLGVNTVLDLPQVGAGLAEHPCAGIQTRTHIPESYGLSWKAAPRNLWNALEYALFRKGPLGGNVFEAHGFVRSAAGAPRPDLQLVFMPCFWNPAAFPLPLGHGYGLLSICVRPKSRGRVSLVSSDPRAAPRIDFNFLSHPDDLDVIRRGLRLARRILAAPALLRHRGQETTPGPSIESDDALNDYIRRTVVMVHHPSSTCRMGTDSESVVDPQLKVRGIERLRVIDASVFPTVVAGNTNAAVVMVAEKGADLILGRPTPAPIDVPHAA